jgi:hypothetical protein
MNHVSSLLSPAHGEHYHANVRLYDFSKKYQNFERGKKLPLSCPTFAFILIAEARGFPAHKYIRNTNRYILKNNFDIIQ